jgi:ribosomal protein S12 methylthiotransferase
MKRIGFVSLGCEKNLVDTEVMMGMLGRRGYEMTRHPVEADVIVVNTCGFIDKAKKESIDTILEMAEFKNSGNCSRLVVTGCLVERYRADLQREIPEVDAVLGTTQLESIIDVCEDHPVPKLRTPTTFTTKILPGFSRHHVTAPTSRSPKAATVLAPFASFPRLGVTTAAVRCNRS